MRKLAILSVAFAFVAVSFYGCGEAATEVLTDPANDQLPTFKVKPGEDYEVVAEWGSFGSGDGQFKSPEGIAMDQQGNVYVVDWLNYRIQKFTSGATFLTKWGGRGWGDGQFNNLQCIAVDKHGNVYVVDFAPAGIGLWGRIQKFTSDGSFLARWEDGEFYGEGIAVDKHGNVYLADTYNNRIQKFDSDGKLLAKWGSYGTADGQFRYPYRVAVDKHKNVYVTDSQNDRVQKFTSDGVFIAKWGSSGSGDGQFNLPRGVAVDKRGSVYVIDQFNDRVQKFTSDGVFLTKWSPTRTPVDLVADRHGNLYLAHPFHRIQVWAPVKH